jgi:hypothetical protein
MDIPIEYLAARRIAETGLSAAELAALPMDEYARVTQRPTFGQTAAQAHEYTTPPASQPAPVQKPDITHQQPDVAGMSWDEYAAYREASGIAARSNEGMSRASISLMDRLYQRNDYGR